jgi:hypothetical protein
MCRVSARRLPIYNFVWGLLKATKKVYLIPQKWKQRYIWDLSDKVCNLNPKTLKSYRNTKSTNRNKKSQIKVCLLYFKSEKKAKIRMGTTQRNLQAQLKILKKLSEHQIYQSGRKFSQKGMLSTLKKQRSRKFVWELPDGICRLNPKSYKNDRNTKSTNQNNNFPKKSMFSALKV